MLTHTASFTVVAKRAVFVPHVFATIDVVILDFHLSSRASKDSHTIARVDYSVLSGA